MPTRPLSERPGEPPAHLCPGCGKVWVANHMLACHPCWLRLPTAHRMVLDRTYRFRQNMPGNWHKAIRVCLEWYKANPPGEVVPDDAA